MKRIILILVLISAVNLTINAQQTVQKKEYYDFYETELKRSWHELGDGTKHGMEKFYFKEEDGGKLAYKINYYKGVPIDLTSYYQDGSIAIKGQKNKDNNYDGEQKFYLFQNGNRFLRAEALVDD